MRYTDTEIQEHRLAYVRALESGEYKQGKNVLTTINRITKDVVGHCCLGVACEVMLKDNEKMNVQDFIDYRSYDDEGYFLPLKVQRWLGLHTDCPDIADSEGGEISAVNANDYREWTFDQIAEGLRKIWNLPPKEEL